WMGGDDYVALHDFLVGYAEGCVYANPENRVAYVFIAEGNNSWANPAKGKELSMALYNNYKTDFIHGVAGGSGDGVFEAVLDIRAGGDKSVWAIGVDADQYLSFMAKDKKETAETILTSALKTVGQPIFAQLQKIVKGEATESGQATYGIAEGAAGIAINDYYKANTPQDVQDFLTKTVEQVSSGTVKVTSAYGLETEALNAIYAKTTVK
ncbi:MAG: BMP family ABC transporter substrate-binding protein, partial [Oscillospiraceae bacterium]